MVSGNTLALIPDSHSTTSDARNTHRVLVAARAQVGLEIGVGHHRQALDTADYLLGGDLLQNPRGVPRAVRVGQEQWPLLVVEQGQEPAPAPRVHDDNLGRLEAGRVNRLDRVGDRRRSRAQDRAYRIATERRHNRETRLTAQAAQAGPAPPDNDPPPF